MENHSRTVDPILNLPVHSFVSSVCFVSPRVSSDEGVSPAPPSTRNHNYEDDNQRHRGGDDDSGSDSDDSDNEEPVFRSASMRSRVRQGLHREQNQTSDLLLRDRFLVSCHRDDGETLLWDLNRQTTVGTVSAPRGGPGLAVRRTHDPSKVMVHTKDPKGIVSLHGTDRCAGYPGRQNSVSTVTSGASGTRSSIIRQFETFSYTFCQAVPCIGDEHLLALPSRDDATVVVVDDRAKELVATYSIKGHGMLTSLAMSLDTSRSCDHAVLVCGMESGTAVFYDLAARVSTGLTQSTSRVSSSVESSYELGKDPILTLDLASSNHDVGGQLCNGHNAIPTSTKNASSLLVAAGMAGDSAEVADMKPEEAGRAVLFKASIQNTSVEATSESLSWKFDDRARLSTCRVDPTSYGKPGVAICRFRPNDGRLLAVGGWDYRIRLFDRVGAPMAILKGNGGGSVIGLDFAPDSSTSGLIVSAPANAMSILVWQCYASPKAY